MRTRFSSHLCPRTARPSVADIAPLGRVQTRNKWDATRRLSLALAASAPLCAGALLANVAQAAPTVESDENGPLVQIIKPGYNDVLKGKYRILIQVTARKYNPQSVEMFIDDVSATPGPLEISSFASSSYDFDTRLMSEGRHKLTVRVTDSQGFRGWSEVTVFVNNKGVVDTQAPDLRWVGIEPFQELSGSIKLEVNATDNFGIKLLKISVSPIDTPNKPAYEWLMNQPPYSVNLDTLKRNTPDGLYVLKALAYDSTDQQGDAPALNFGIVNNQINATRVQDMLDGQRQMQKVLAGEKLAAPTPQKTAPTTATQARADAAVALNKADEILGKAAPQPLAPTTEQPADVLATPAQSAPARSSVPETQIRPLPQELPAPSLPAPSLAPQSAPSVSAPSLNIAPQTPSNPGIQLPRVQVPSMPQETAPPAVAPTETQTAPINDVTRDAELTPGNLAPPAQTAPAQTAPTETAPSAAVTTPSEIAPNAATAPTATVPNQAATATVPPVEVAPQSRQSVDEKTRIAMNQSLPVSQRNGGQASLSRAAAIDLAVAAPSGAMIERAPGSQPIAVARFSQPSLSGRNVTDMPVMSQSASAQARLSNAELLRARPGKTRVLGAASVLRGAKISAPVNARALQTSAPALAQRPILGRAVTADSIGAPASKLARQAQKPALAARANKPALSGSLSKTVLSGQRLAPIAPEAVTKSGAQTATSSVPRDAVANANSSSQNAVPQQTEASARFARNGAPNAAPQMSAPNRPRMSESASGLGVPERTLAKAAPALNSATKTLDQQRVAALPRPGAVTSNRTGGALIVATPLNSPLEIAASTALPTPTSYRAERNTTLRAVAARYGLPVELVAISNGLATDAKLAAGTEVKLPRPLQVSYNGAPVTGDAPSMLMGDTAVMAFRFMFEKTGGKMEWDAKNQRVVARKDGHEITLTIGSNVAKVGEREVMMEIAAFLFQGRTMVPLRLFEEGLNAQVDWNPQTGRLVVAMAG